MNYDLIHGDCLAVMETMDPGSADAIVTDPPYGLSFMNKRWDHGLPPIGVWLECLRVLKPGGYLMAFGGDRTHHRLMVAIEDAGFEIRTCVYWLFGSGFPKSLNVGKAMRSQLSSDVLCSCGSRCSRTAQDSRCDCPACLRSDGEQPPRGSDTGRGVAPSRCDVPGRIHSDLPVGGLASGAASISPDGDTCHHSSGCSSRPPSPPSVASRESDSIPSDRGESTSRGQRKGSRRTASCRSGIRDSGGDSASSSSKSPLVMDPNIPYCQACGKIMSERFDGLGTTLKPAAEIIVVARKPLDGTVVDNVLKHGTGALGIEECKTTEGRWPPSVLLQHHPDCGESCDAECVVRTLGEQSGERKSTGGKTGRVGCGGKYNGGWSGDNPGSTAGGLGDTGTAARFYPQFRYEPKASRRDRNEGCEGMEAKASDVFGDDEWGRKNRDVQPSANSHSCVKPTPLLEWLVKLACPAGGTVLDPFMGSGSTGKACMRAGRRFIGIEQDGQWIEVARARIACAETAIDAHERRDG